MSVARTSLLLALALAGLCAPRAPAAGEDGPGSLSKSWRALVEAGTTAYQQGHSAEAEALLGEALEEAEAAWPGREQVAESLLALAGCHRAARMAQAGEAACRQALALEEARLGPDHPGLVPILHTLARILSDQRRYEDAGEQYGRARAIQEKALREKEDALGPDSLELIADLDVLATLSGEMLGPWEEEPHRNRQLEICRRSLAAREAQFGPEHPAVAEALVVMAGVLRVRGPDAGAEAAKLYERALAIREKELGEEHPDLVGVLESLAISYDCEGKHAEALPYYRRAVAIREKARPTDYAGLDRSLALLWGLYTQLGMYREEEAVQGRRIELREQLLERQEEELGPDHPAVGFAVEDLAKLCQLSQSEADSRKAGPLYERALAIKEGWLGREHPGLVRTLSDLARVYSGQQTRAAAEPLLVRAIGIRKIAPGQEQPEASDLQRQLADVYSAQGRRAEAAEARNREREFELKKQIAFLRESPDPDSPLPVEPVIELGALYRAEGRLEEARARYEEALAMQEEQLGPDHPDLVGTLQALAEVAHAQGKAEEGKACHERAQAISQAALRGGAEATAGLVEELGTSEERARARALVIEAQEALRVVGYGGPTRPGSPEGEADDRLVELRRELVAMGPAAVMALLETPQRERYGGIADWQRSTIRDIGGRAVPVLGAALSDPRPEVRAFAAGCLEQMDAPAAWDALAKALRPEDSPLREDLSGRWFYVPDRLADDPRFAEALIAVWELKAARARGEEWGGDAAGLRELLTDLTEEWWERSGDESPAEGREAAANALGKLVALLGALRDPDAVPLLAHALAHPESQPAGMARGELIAMGAVAAEPVAGLLSGADPRVSYAALSVLEHVGVPEDAYPAVVACLDHSERDVRLQAARLLSFLNPEMVVPSLLLRLEETRRPETTEDGEDRAWLVRALGQLGDPRAVPPLLAILTEEKGRVRAVALESLVWLEAPGLEDQLRQVVSDPEQAWVLMEMTLVNLRPAIPDPVPFLLTVLESEADPQVRVHVAWALGRLGDRRAVQPLIRVAKAYRNATGPYYPGLASASAEALGEVGDPAAVLVLLEFIGGQQMSQRAVTALGQIGDQRAREPLRKMLEDAEPGSFDEHYLAVALGSLGDVSAIPALKERLKSGFHGDGLPPLCPHYNYTEQAAQALARIGEPAVPVLLDALDSQYEHTADYAALALGEIGDARALEPLIGLLDRRSDRTRHHAAVALGELGDPAAIPHLREAARDRSAYVRAGAGEALWQLGEEEGLSVLVEARRDGSEDWERAEAVKALGRLGAPAAVGALEQALHDRAFRVRWAARTALRELQPQH